MRRVLQSAVITLVVAATVPAFADLTIVSKLSEDGKTEAATSYLSANKARMVQPGGHEIIVDGTKSEMYLVDNNKKEYSVMTKEEMEQAAVRMREQMKQASAQMEEAMKDAPPEVREQMKKAMGNMNGGMAAAVDVQKGTGGRQIAGYKCENWIVVIGEMSKTEECLSTDLPVPTGSWDSFRSMEDSLQSNPAAKAMQEKMKEAKGFPLASTTTTKIMGKTQTSSTEVQEIKKDPIAPSVFEVPAGYKKVDSPMKESMKSMPAKK